MTELYLKIGKRIRFIRKEQNMSQEDLAFATKLHRTYISDVERGTRNISIKNLEKISKALKVKTSSLIE